MNISIQPFTDDWIPQVEAFNRRMLAGGLKAELAFPESPVLDFSLRNAPIWQEAFLAVEDQDVRGAYYFTHERYALGGNACWMANYRHPISEVVVNKAYKGLSKTLLSDAEQRQPLLYSVGFGSDRNPNLRRLRAEGWSDVLIPFWFRVVRPAAFFRNLAFFRKTQLRRLAFDLAAATGVGWLGIKAVQSIKAFGSPGLTGHSVQTAPEFGPWADELWEMNRPLYLLAAVRDRQTLNLRYSPENPRFVRLVVAKNGCVVGWAVLLDKQMRDNPYFGDMHVGTIVDCLAVPGQELAVVRAAAARLETAGADIVVSNQSAATWSGAFGRAGFLSGPSNYYLSFSPELVRRLSPLDQNTPRFHINRGDGAGTSRL